MSGSPKEIEPGPALYILATPIGNLEDISLRALRILEQVDLIFCEDTRTTAKLLNYYQLKTPLKSFRVHRQKSDTERLLEELAGGKNLAFVSEAGTPGISDPGSFLVRAVRSEQPKTPVIPIPGPSALAAALSISGFQSNPTLYLGFLSPKGGRRRKSLQSYSEFEGAIVIYESVHRIEKSLADIAEIYPDREILITRELTKKFEEAVLLDSPEKIGAYLELASSKKGEFTLIIGPLK